MPLIQIGSIKTKQVFNNKVRPYINVQFLGFPEKQIPAELIPMLVLNSHYDNKVRTTPHQRDNIEIKVSGDYQKIPSDKRISIVLQAGNIKAAIPCLELARTLFLHNVHLTRTALRPNGLRGMANVDRSGKETIIKFHKMSDYPLTNLSSHSACQHLRWLLLNPDAKKSFNSIYQCLRQGEQRNWLFNFTPPPLKDWRFSFAGQYDSADPTLFHVEEIKRVYTPYFSYDKKVSIFHPNKKELIPIEPTNGRRPEVNRSDPDPMLDFKATPALNRKHDVVSEDGFRFVCGTNNDVKVLPGADQTRVIPNINMDKTPTPDITGVGHGTAAGSAQELDWAINRADDEDNPLEEPEEAAPTDNFQIFERVIKRLMALDDYTHISTQCLSMPIPNNGSQIYKNKATHLPRTYHCAYFSYQDLPLVIIEVDISDLNDKHKLGSRLFGFSESGKKGLMQVMKACAEKGVHWDAVVNKSHCSIVVEIKHPFRTKKVDGKTVCRTNSEYEDAWVEALRRAVENASPR